jgi:class 3 adenylate cyclase
MTWRGLRGAKPAVVDRDRWAIDRVTLRFRNRALERSFQAAFAQQNLPNLRVGHALGVILWIVWGALIRGHMGDQREFDFAVRYGVFIPIVLIGLAMTFFPGYPRVWKWEVMAVLLATSLTWIVYAPQITGLPADYGYVGLILIQTIAFSVLRLPFTLIGLLDLVTIPTYLAFAVSSGSLAGAQTELAIFYLASFGVLGLIASYVLEWTGRNLFVRERQLDQEHDRSDSLLLNVLPAPIADRLKARDEAGGSEYLAEALDEVTVLFVDAVGFTGQTAKMPADQLVAALDGLFSRFDAIADRCGLEKIKTVGDAYMAVAGAPEPRADHAQAAVEMALAIREELPGALWPTGDPIQVRMGMASGPVVAGVIGQRKFAYDLWGDTVNLASRLHGLGQPGDILVSDGVVARLGPDYLMGPEMVLDVKGLGPTPARKLLGRAGRLGS